VLVSEGAGVGVVGVSDGAGVISGDSLTIVNKFVDRSSSLVQ
jgi:hypothetical protein